MQPETDSEIYHRNLKKNFKNKKGSLNISFPFATVLNLLQYDVNSMSMNLRSLEPVCSLSVSQPYIHTTNKSSLFAEVGPIN